MESPVALRRKERALLAYVAVNGRPHTRQELLSLFCATANDPLAALRLLLSRIRRQVGGDLLLLSGDQVQWNPAIVLDYHQFEATLQGQPTTEALATALDLYRGDFLAGLSLDDNPEFDLWLLHRQAHLRQLYERGLTELVNRLISGRQFQAAIGRAQQLVSSDPLRETAHGSLIWLYGQTGQHEAAQAQYEQCCQILARELAVEPTPELRALYQEVAAGRGQTRPRPAAIPAPLLPDPLSLVGREAALSQLGQAWLAAQQGHGQVVWIEAEAGGGKSALVQHFIRQQAMPAFSGDCYESSRHLPYLPWSDLLEDYLQWFGLPQLSQLPTLSRDYLARLLPTWAGRLGYASPPKLPAGQDATHLFYTVADLVLARPGARLLFLDNLQWADEATLRLFHFLARRVAGHAVLLVGATRPVLEAANPPLAMLWQDLQRQGVRPLNLTPLTDEAIEQWLAARWPTLPAAKRPMVSGRLHRATGGNPLFLSELLRELTGREDLPETLPVPASVLELVRARLAQLPASSQQILEALAILDAQAPPELIQATAGRSEEETILALDGGHRQGLLRAGEPYDFSHDLLREAILSGVSPLRGRLLHRRAAQAMAQEADHLPASQQPEPAGRILAHAQAGNDYGLVFHWGHPAARYAAQIHAYGNALKNLQAATAAYAQLPHTPANDSRYVEMLLDQALLVSMTAGPLADEERLVEMAAALLKQNPSPRLQAIYYLRLAGVYGSQGRFGDGAVEALNAYEHFMDLDDLAGAAYSLFLAGGQKITISQNHLGQSLLDRALVLYRAVNDPAGEVLSLSNLAWVHLNLGQVQQALAVLEQGLAITRQTGDILGQTRICATLAAAWSFFYQADKMLFYSQQARQLAHQMGLPPLRANLYQAISVGLLGRPAESQQMLQTVFQQATEADDQWPAGWAAQLLGRMALGQGNLPEAEKWLEWAAGQRQQTGELSNQVSDLAWLGRLRRLQGQLDQAFSLTSAAVQRLEALRGECYVWESADVFVAYVEVLVALGGRPAEVAHYRQLAAEAAHFLAQQLTDPEMVAQFYRFALPSRE